MPGCPVLTVQTLPASLWAPGRDFGQGQPDPTAQRRPGASQAQSRDKTAPVMGPLHSVVICETTQSTREIPFCLCFTEFHLWIPNPWRSPRPGWRWL